MTNEDDHKPREHDHLVEPMYAGLGCSGDEDGATDEAPANTAEGLWGVLGRFLRALKRERS